MFGPLRNRRQRNIVIQGFVLGLVLALFAYLARNAAINLENSGITSGFDFIWERSGYDISFALIDYSPKTATHAYAWLVGTTNTIFFAICTITTTTFLALWLAMGRLSQNWLLSALSRIFVEYVRNVPMLVHIFIWYALYLALPKARQAIAIGDVAFLSNRGLIMPAINWPFSWQQSAILAVVIAILTFGLLKGMRQMSLWLRVGALCVAILAVVWGYSLIVGGHFSLDVPIQKGFGFRGGMTLAPEFLVMWTAVTVYSSAHCSEIIRGAIIAVPKGQAEAARALGDSQRQVMLDIVIPQALRAMIPPMTSNYINILKAAALGTAVGFLDVMGTTGGSTLNITGQANECILIVMVTYMVLNLALSSLMGRINKAVQIKER